MSWLFFFILSRTINREKRKGTVQKVSPCDSSSSTWVLGMSNLVFWDYLQIKRFYNRETIPIIKIPPLAESYPTLSLWTGIFELRKGFII